MNKWQLQKAKAKFSQLVKQAASTGPQEVTVRGEAAVVVLGKKEYDRLTAPKPGFVSFMRSSPLAGVELDLRRDQEQTREVGL